MKAMVLDVQGGPLRERDVEHPVPGPGQLLVSVSACGVCRTDLHVVDGELPHPKPALIPGHEIVGRVFARGTGASLFELGERVGVPWLGSTCGRCEYCLAGRENLCEAALFTGYTLDGGYAEYAVADERYCLRLPEQYGDAEAAPLLCAGLIGYRALKAAAEAQRLGIYGFGAAAHIITQVAHGQGRDVYAFTRPGDLSGQQFARDLGAAWAGDSLTAPPRLLDAALIFAPVGALIPQALRHLAKGGSVVAAGIHMSDIPQFSYDLLWGERCVRSVANLTRSDGEEFFELAARFGVRTEVETFPLQAANIALDRLRAGEVRGAAVLLTEQARQVPGDRT